MPGAAAALTTSTSLDGSVPQQFDEYRLVRVLGSGSMGVVFLGHDTVLDRPVAIKFIRGREITPRARDRFLTEARAAARILHPNVMAIHRIGELEGRLYIISEFVRGKPLDTLALPISWQEALTIGLGVARGLAAAHRHGVLHRDIKLANVMRSESGEVKLLDFGLAKLVAEDGAPVLVDAAGADPMSDLAVDDTRDLDDTLDATRPRINAVTAIRGDHGRQPVPAAPEPSHDEGLEIVVGTPYYMAPELWRAEPASRASDVYALGVLLYVLCAGHPPLEAGNTLQLASLSQETSAPPLRDAAPGVDPRFAKIVDRCLQRDAAARYPSADELCSALELLWSSGPLAEAVRGNPYRGLQAFEARHRAVFFGRAVEIRAVVDRLRGQPFVLVAGDSGVGKSSLCRAGVLPALAEPPGLGDRLWASLTLIPGRRPFQTLLSALSSHLSLKEDELRPQLRDEPGALVRLLARRQGRDHGLVLFVDQLEEVITLAEPEQRDPFLRFLAALVGDVPSLRLLASVRGDFLTRAAALPAIGPRINAAVHILTPLAREGMRDAIAGPAALQGVHFEPEGLIDELVRAGVEGSLPLLQFALAELWEVREASSKVITAADLEQIGRVTGALARHADNVIAGLPASQRSAARRMLLRLVTIEDTRASLALDDLVAGDPAGELALEALVAGRLVVAREAQDGTVHEIAHEALIRSWGALQRWIGEERETREIRHRLELAALEWQRLGHGRAGLWTAEQLAEAGRLDEASLRRRERDFLAASAAQRRRQRALRIALAATLPLALGLVYTGIRVEQSLALQRKIHAKMDVARETFKKARAEEREATRLRALALQRFDGRDPDSGETLWTQALAALGRSDATYKQAAQHLDVVLGLDADTATARQMMADLLLERARLMDVLHQPALIEELIERLKIYDDGSRLAAWRAPGRVEIRTEPTGARVWLGEYAVDASGRQALGELRDLGVSPVAPLTLEQGSYALKIEAPGLDPIAYPFVVERGEALTHALRLPAPGRVPADFAYVPAGRFLFGSADEEMIRSKFYLTVPQHQVTTDAYLIAKHETTYADWIAFLEALPPEQRAKHIPGSVTDKLHLGVTLQPHATAGWALTLAWGWHRLSATAGERIVYPGRQTLGEHDWLAMPVSGISWADAQAYLQWLDRSGKVPGARMCTELEWERAARGADGRLFPHGVRLEPLDANIDQTYGKDASKMGPDAVGSHPASRSPFGIDDAVGNVWEWVESSLVRGERVMRSGAFFYDEVTCVSANRYIPDPEIRDGTLGLRVCASVDIATP